MITEINNSPLTISYFEYLSQQYFAKYFVEVKPGETVTLQNAEQTFNVKTASNPVNSSIAYLGVTVEPLVNGDKDSFFGFMNLFTWMWILNYTIAIVNLAPLYPLDGGLMVKALAEKISKKYGMKITIGVTLITVTIFLVNTIAPFIIQYLFA
ncbi:MAG: site-2 protease family protein [Candidatus Aenigmatarchaeota archaeon]